MFNSQKTNHDPAPYVVAGYHKNGREATWRGIARDDDHAIEQWDEQFPNADIHTLGFAPRGAFDNTPNPVLLAVRDYIVEANVAEMARAFQLWLGLIVRGTLSRPDAPAAVALYMSLGVNIHQIDHARKVLERLVYLSGQEG